MANLLFEPLFGELEGNVTLSIARWEARGRLSIRDKLTFSLTVTVEK